MDGATILLILGCMAAGALGGVINSWALHRRVYSLEERVSELETVKIRVMKQEAARARWEPKADPELVKKLVEQTSEKSFANEW
jgi:hypothetical protein